MAYTLKGKSCDTHNLYGESVNFGDYAFLNVKRYGAVGDGEHDDAQAIRSCISDAPQSNFVVFFPTGEYLQGDGTNPDYDNITDILSAVGQANIGKAIYFDFKNKSGFSVIGYNAKVFSHHENTCIQNNRGFWFEGCSDFFVKGLSYDGNLEARNMHYDDWGVINRQNGFDFRDCINFCVEDVTSDRCCMDGFFIGSEQTGKFSENATFIHCKGDQNYRQGLTLFSSKNTTIDKCRLTRTGTVLGPRLGPWNEIDIEGPYNDTILIKECYFEGSKSGIGVDACENATNLIIEDCTFIDDVPIIQLQEKPDGRYSDQSGAIIKNCYINATNTLRNPLIEVRGGSCTFEDNHVINAVLDVRTDLYPNKARNVIRNNRIEYIFIPTEEDIKYDAITYDPPKKLDYLDGTNRNIVIFDENCVFDNNTVRNVCGEGITFHTNSKIHSFCGNTIYSDVKLPSGAAYTSRHNIQYADICEGNQIDRFNNMKFEQI